VCVCVCVCVCVYVRGNTDTAEAMTGGTYIRRRNAQATRCALTYIDGRKRNWSATLLTWLDVLSAGKRSAHGIRPEEWRSQGIRRTCMFLRDRGRRVTIFGGDDIDSA